MTSITLPNKGDQNWDETLNADLTTLNTDKVDKTQEAQDIAAAIAAHAVATDPHGDRAAAAGVATAAVSSHASTADAHGDRADAATKYLLKTDPSVTNSRTPTAHAGSHSAGGSDPISLAGIGALSAASVGNTTDFQPHGTAAAGSTGRYADAGHIHPSPFWVPGDNNLLSATYDPAHAGTVTSQANASVAGKITLTKVVLRQTITWSNVWFGLSGVDGAAVLSNCYIGVYDAAGNLKAVTADLSSVLTVNPVAKAVSFTTPFTAAPGTYFIALLLNGTWATNSFTFKSSGAGVSVNAGLTAPNLRYSNLLTGQTSLPATLSLASQTSTIITGGWGSMWYGIS